MVSGNLKLEMKFARDMKDNMKGFYISSNRLNKKYVINCQWTPTGLRCSMSSFASVFTKTGIPDVWAH